MNDLLTAIGLVFIIEGLLLFYSPKRLAELVKLISTLSPKKIRSLGLFFILLGIMLLYIIRKT